MRLVRNWKTESAEEVPGEKSGYEFGTGFSLGEEALLRLIQDRNKRAETDMGQDRDFKYILQDAGRIYLGARFSYQELLEEEMLGFKLKTVISQYILKEVDASATLESHFYHMAEDSFSYKTYQELKVKVKVSMPEEKRGLTGKVRTVYADKEYGLKEFAGLNLARKKQSGLIVREIVVSKLGLMTFTV